MDLYGTWTYYRYPSDCPIPDRSILQHLTASPDERLWMSVWNEDSYIIDGKLISGGSTVGILMFDREGWIFYPLGERGLPKQDIRHLACDLAGRVWLYMSPGTICRFDGRTTEIFQGGEKGLASHAGFVDAFAVDGEGSLWAALGTSGAWRLGGSKWERLPLTGYTVSNVTVDQIGRIWFAVTNDDYVSFVRYDGTHVVEYARAPVSIDTAQVRALAVDKTGRLWVGWSYTSGDIETGLWALDRAGGQWTQYTTENSALPDPNIESICVDRVGRVWVGTSVGLAIFDETESVCWQIIIPGVSHGPLDEEDMEEAKARGDSRAYAFIGHYVVTDMQGRIWTLTGRNGVSVFSEG